MLQYSKYTWLHIYNIYIYKYLSIAPNGTNSLYTVLCCCITLIYLLYFVVYILCIVLSAKESQIYIDHPFGRNGHGGFIRDMLIELSFLVDISINARNIFTYEI